MTATNQFEDDLLDLIFTNVAAPFVGDTAGLLPSAAAGKLYISLHTGTLADSHTDQTQTEADYTGYARIAVPRTTAEWTVASGNVDNDNVLSYAQCTGGSNSVTDFGIGFLGSLTAGYLQLFGVLSPGPLAVSNLITPQFSAGSLDISID